jgi:ectoine hydroxylase-related dioxygenase (phytanoyl-CoA dioxygenase family)
VPGITATWFLDPFTTDNGATRMLPGSHRNPPPSAEVPIPGTETPGEGETLGCGPAGSVLIRDARLFHAGGLNRTQEHRRSALVFFQHDVPDT